MVNVWITLFSSLISGILGVAISTWYYRQYENKKYKVESLKKFMGNRYDLTGDEFSRALNEIFVVYKDSPKVMEALSRYHDSIISPKDSEGDLIFLFKAMCTDVGIKYEKFNDSFFLRPFNARASSTLKP